MKKITLLTTIILAVITATAQIINIPADYPTIQEGIDAANNGDTVLDEQRTYFENIKFSDKAIIIASHYLIETDSSYISNNTIFAKTKNNEITWDFNLLPVYWRID